MIAEVIECVYQLNQKIHLNQINLVSSDLLLVLYIATYKRSHRFGVAFLVSELLSFTAFFNVFDSFDIVGEPGLFEMYFFLGLAAANSVLFINPAMETGRKSVKFICSMIILFYLLMAGGYYFGGSFATFIYNGYEGIIFSLHVMLVLSFYKPKPIIDRMVDKLCDLCASAFNSNAANFIWYNAMQPNTGR